MKRFALPLLLVGAAGFASADETTVCSAHGSERTITVSSDAKGCQVNYTKGTETKTLWQSPHAEYCTARAAEFIEKQKGWGYECTAKTAAAPVATQ